VSGVIVDASVAIKWVCPEAHSIQAMSVLENRRLIAPDLLTAECANILWKKTRRAEITYETAQLAAKALQRIDIELVPMRRTLTSVLKLAVALDHPAYDCLYLVLALERDCQFVTADKRLLNKLNQTKDQRFADRAISLADIDINKPAPKQ